MIRHQKVLYCVGLRKNDLRCWRMAAAFRQPDLLYSLLVSGHELRGRKPASLELDVIGTMAERLPTKRSQERFQPVLLAFLRIFTACCYWINAMIFDKPRSGAFSSAAAEFKYSFTASSGVALPPSFSLKCSCCLSCASAASYREACIVFLWY